MQILHNIHKVNQIASALFEDGCEITTTQAIVLRALGEKPGSSQTDLVAMTGVDRSTLADVMRRMKTKGFIKRVRSKKDARAYVCELTSDGVKVLSGAITAAAQAERELLLKVPAVKSLRIAA